MKFKEFSEKLNGILDLAEGKLYIDTEVHSGTQPWEIMAQQMKDIIAKRERVSQDEADTVRGVYQAAFETAQEVEKKLSRLLKKVAPKDSKILIDIKKEAAFVDKVINRGKDAAKITDVLRSAVLVETDSDLDKFIKNLEKHADIYEHEYKAKGEDKGFGYHGSHHFLISIDNVLIEVQAMTKRLWTFKSPAHGIYEKWRSIKEFDDLIAKNDKKAKKDVEKSKELFRKGNQNYYELEAGDRLSKYKDFKRGKYAQKFDFAN